VHPIFKLSLVGLLAALLAACGGGENTVQLQSPNPPPPVNVSVTGNDTATEGNLAEDLSFGIELSQPATSDIDISFATRSDTAIEGSDFIARAGDVTIAAGQTSASVDITIIDDSIDEPDERLFLDVTATSQGAIATASAAGTILDDDAPSSISVADASIAEGDAGQSTLTFAVTLDRESGHNVSVDYATANGTASAGADYAAISGQLNLRAGTTSASVDVTVLADTVDETDETLTLQLSNATNATIGDATAQGTIIDDDSAVPPAVNVSIGPAANSAEGGSLVYPVSLSMASAVDIDIQYQTRAGSATSGADFVPQTSSITVPAGSLAGSIVIATLDDGLDEPNETVNVDLLSVSSGVIATGSASGTIVDDDAPPSISIGDAAVAEGDAGQQTLSFLLSLSAMSGFDIAVDYQTSDGTATAGSDYTAVSGQGTIPAGSLSTTIAVAVMGDTVDEPDETFTVMLSNAANASIADAQATGTINDDDGTPTLSIADASVAEGDAGQSHMTFAVSLSAQSGSDVTFDYASADGTATAGSDYTAVNGQGTIAAGSLSTTIAVAVTGDTVEEADETFSVSIANSVNATIVDGVATGTILEDDPDAESGLPARPNNLTCLAPDQPITNASVSVVSAFPNLPDLVEPVGLVAAPNDSTQWYVIERAGRILRFANDAATLTASTFVDIRSPGDPIDVKSDHGETGLLGMAFHPGYGVANWYVYLSYTIDGRPAGGREYRSVIARFESKDTGLTLDATDAVTLLTLDQPARNHNGGQITFGPDGYLYVAFGDGGGSGDQFDRTQNTTNLFGSILRIDVDAGSPYSIPQNNPFVGNSLCASGSGASSCPEIYAWGLRNPWKWSFDDVTGKLWLGDVGQDTWEEVNVIELGGNYGWRCREGAHDFNTTGNCPPGLIDPLIEYSHAIGFSITGGYVYRGSAIPELIGRYVFADYGTGKIFASTDQGDGTFSFEELIDTSHLISAFAVDENGEILFTRLFDSGNDIYRIVQSGGNSNDPIPDQLSATGCVMAADPTQPADGLVPYDINVPFWSDGAVKQRWYAIPDNTTIDVAADGDWLFPIGTVLMKNFRLTNELIETRLFMRHTNGEWGGYTYEWNDTGTDATRVIGGKVKSINGQDWIYPSGSECMQCHTQAANFSLGLEHGQLNKDFTYPSTGITANQLVTADFIDVLTDPLPDVPANLPQFVDPADVGETLEDRARAYLHSNCAGCHRPTGPTPSNIDLRHDTPLGSTNTCDVVPTSGDLGIAGARIIDPGSAATSVLVERPNRRDVHGMPPLGSNVIDAAGVQLLTDWVNSLAGCP